MPKTFEIDLHQEIDAIKQRNKRVESDKAWETSEFRKITLAIMTYFVALLFMYAIGVKDAWLNAIIPTGGFILSTQSLPFIKRWWLAHRYHA